MKDINFHTNRLLSVGLVFLYSLIPLLNSKSIQSFKSFSQELQSALVSVHRQSGFKWTIQSLAPLVHSHHSFTLKCYVYLNVLTSLAHSIHGVTHSLCSLSHEFVNSFIAHFIHGVTYSHCSLSHEFINLFSCCKRGRRE